MALLKAHFLGLIIGLSLNGSMLHAWSAAGHELFKLPLTWAGESAANKFEIKSFSEVGKLAAQGSLDFVITDKPSRGVKAANVFPVAISGLSVVYRIDGFATGVKLSWKNLKEIIEGKIVIWGDENLVAENPQLKGNSTPIVFVHSKESFGMLQIFGAIMKREKLRLTKPKYGVRVTSPKLVAATIKNTNGALGLVDYSWQQEYQLKAAALKNKSNQFVSPNKETLRASADVAFKKLGDRYNSILLNPEGTNSYPLYGFMYFVVVKKNASPQERVRLIDLVSKLLSPTGDEVLERAGFEALRETHKKSIKLN